MSYNLSCGEFMAGAQEILLLIGLALLLFGPKKIPEIARALGKATTEYKRGIQEAKRTIMSDDENPLSSEEKEIVTAAKKLGIATEGRSVEEIASDLVAHSSDA